MRVFQLLFLALTRILLSSYFIIASLIKIFSWGIEERQLFESLTVWEQIIPRNGLVYTILAELLQAPTILIGLSFGTYLVLGVMFLLGIRKGVSVTILSASLVVAGVLFHPFWLFEGEQFDVELLAFCMNISIVGGLLTHLMLETHRSHSFDYEEAPLKMKFRDEE